MYLPATAAAKNSKRRSQDLNTWHLKEAVARLDHSTRQLLSEKKNKTASILFVNFLVSVLFTVWRVRSVVSQDGKSCSGVVVIFFQGKGSEMERKKERKGEGERDKQTFENPSIPDVFLNLLACVFPLDIESATLWTFFWLVWSRLSLKKTPENEGQWAKNKSYGTENCVFVECPFSEILAARTISGRPAAHHQSYFCTIETYKIYLSLTNLFPATPVTVVFVWQKNENEQK